MRWTHSSARTGSELRYTFVYWILPGLLGWRSALALEPMARSGAMAGLAATVFSFHRPYGRVYHRGPMAPIYLKAAVPQRHRLYAGPCSFILVYQTRGRSLVTATRCWSSLSLWHSTCYGMPGPSSIRRLCWRRQWNGAGEASWAMNYWPLSGCQADAAYADFLRDEGIASQHLQGKLSRQVLFEFLIVAVVGIAVLMVFRP